MTAENDHVCWWDLCDHNEAKVEAIRNQLKEARELVRIVAGTVEAHGHSITQDGSPWMERARRLLSEKTDQ